MTDAPAPRRSLYDTSDRIRRRNAGEKRFRAMGISAIAVSILALAMLLVSVLGSGLGAFRQTFVTIPVTLDAAVLDKAGNRNPDEMKKVTTVGYEKVLRKALVDAIATAGLPVGDLTEKEIGALLSQEAPATLRNQVLADPALVGQTVTLDVLANGRVDGFLKGRVTLQSAERDSNISPAQLQLVQAMQGAGMVGLAFNPAFLTAPDASDLRPEAAGLGVAILGSAYMMLVVLLLALPIGVGAAIYLEEFAPKNRFTDLIEVNISNLAAVPSIVYGILGLAVFINIFELPRSAPIVGGLVLTLMTLPRIIIPARAALKSVPPSIRDAALGVGASRLQAVFHHVLPLAMPGILTGVIIGLAQALGETAPLLLIGMVAFVKGYPAAPPEGLFDAASALPVQVYNFTTRGDPAFVERASGAIVVLLVFLIVMNTAAVLLRRRFERRW
jgi:phosphate transport system permease protein